MTNYPIPALDTGLGIPSQSSDTIGAKPAPIFLSSHPEAISFSNEVAASQTLAALQVVGVNSAGRLVKATYDADPEVAINPVGVLAEAITTSSSTSYKGALVWKTGHFNLDRLVWDASFDTEAKKLAAIRLLEPNLKVGEPKTYTP